MHFLKHYCIKIKDVYYDIILSKCYLIVLIVCRVITEAGYNYSDVDYLGDCKDIMQKLADCSPCKHVHKVQAPTLLLLGGKDLRVPTAQNLYYYHLLKKHGVTAK